MCTLHVVSNRCYTSSLHIITTDIYVFVLLWHQGLYPTIEELEWSVCSHWVSACFILTCVASHLLGRCCLQGSKTWRSYCCHWTCDTPRVDRLLTTLPILCPAISISLDAFRSSRLATDLQKTSTWNKLSSLGYRYLTPISSLLGCNPWCHGGGWCIPSAAHRPCVHQNQNSSYHQSDYPIFGNTFVQSVGFGCLQNNCCISGSVFL